MASYSVLAHDGQAYGPVDEVGLIHWANEGRVSATTSIRCEESGVVVPGGQVPCLRPIFVSAPNSGAGGGAMSGSSVAAPQPQVGVGASSGAGTAGAMVGVEAGAMGTTGTVTGGAAGHGLSSFSVGGLVVLSIVTLGIFPWIWFGLMHGKLPKNRPDDPSATKAILFGLIPFFNFYWMFFVNLRLCDRVTEQRQLYGLPERSIKGLMIAAGVANLASLIAGPIGLVSFVLWIVFFAKMQGQVNELVEGN